MTNTMKLKELSYPVSQYWVKIRLGSGYFFLQKKFLEYEKFEHSNLKNELLHSED